MRAFLAHPPQGFIAECLSDGMPAFTAPFDLLTTAEPSLRRRVEQWPLHGLWRRWLRPRVRFIGATSTEYAWLPADADPAALARLLRETQSRLCPLLIVKDIPYDSPLLDTAANAWLQSFIGHCTSEGFVMLQGQALAWVPIDFLSLDDYLSRLSRGRRRDIRRKLRSRAGLQVETLAAGAAFDEATIDAFHALYRNVYAQSDLHFDFLGRDFLGSLLRDAGNGGVVFVYRHDGRMIGWNLCFEYAGMLVDKYVGFVYPAAREHNLYAVSWMENLEYARSRGLRSYVAGWTDPQVKAQLGARFAFTRHAVYPRSRWLRFALRRLARHFESDRAWYETVQPCNR